MLSIWKQAWKDSDSPGASPEDSLGASGNSSPFAAVYTNGSTSSSLDKRPNLRTEPSTRPPKRPRTDLGQTSRLNNDDKLSEANDWHNTVMILPMNQPMIMPLVQLLIRVTENHQTHPSPTQERRTALLVINQESTNSYETSIRSKATSISVQSYNKIGGILEVEPWDDLLQSDVVIVSCNHLLQSLTRGALSITQLHTLIFCDVINAEGHIMVAIRRIMDNFYRVTNISSRPHVLGFMTLPATTGEPAAFILQEIEASLDSKVVDLTDRDLKEVPFRSCCHHEVVLTYRAATQSLVPTLLEALKPINSSESFFPKTSRDSLEVLDELGPCASDLVWRRAMKDVSSPHTKDKADEIAASVQNRVRGRIKNWTFAMPNADPSSRGYNVSPKFSVLLKALESFEPYGEEFRAMVVVRGKEIALSIMDLLRNLNDQLGFLRPITLLGPGLRSDVTCQDILHLFMTGTYNLLITRESDQPLNLSRVSVIIRFDSTTPLAYPKKLNQKCQSHLIHLIEENHGSSKKTMEQSARAHGERASINQPSKSNILPTWTSPIADIAADKVHEFIQDPTAGGRIYRNSTAVGVVHSITAEGFPNGSTSGKPAFHFHEQRDRACSLTTFVCTVILPGPFKATGPPCTSEYEAQCAACFKVCQTFSSLGLLDCHYFPPPPKALPNIPNNSASNLSSNVRSAGTRQYTRKDPDFWVNTKNVPITSLFPMVFSITPANKDEPYSPVAILTRQPLPDLSSFNLYFSGIPKAMHIKRCAALQLEEDQLNYLYLYTLRLTRTITNKPFECVFSDMVYFFAPLPTEWAASETNAPNAPYSLPSIADFIPWHLVRLGGNHHSFPLKMTTLKEIENDIQDAVIQDRSVEFTRRYTTVKARSDLSPLSRPRDSGLEEPYDSILAYCKAKRKHFEGLRDENQPLIEVSTVPVVLNQLNPASRPPPLLKSHAKYLIPELCSKSTIPASTLRTALLLPSITQRIDDLLLAKELNAKLFDYTISDKILHMALCTPSCGVEYDYERLELLGDAFLKYISSIYVFVAHPIYTEGFLHVARQALISNKSLFHLAIRLGLPSYIQSKLFSPKQWHPPNFILPPPMKEADASSPAEFAETSLRVKDTEQPVDLPLAVKAMTSVTEACPPKRKQTTRRTASRRKRKSKREATTQWLGDKAVADVAEAIIGAGYITGGQEIGLKIVKALGIPLSSIHCWSDFSNQLGFPTSNPISSPSPESLKAVEDIIGYKIKNPSLLAQALTHSSIPGHDKIVSERLEFIGDAILDLMVIRHIYDREQQLSPGGLTLLKGAMVSNSAFAAVCVCSGLHQYLLLNPHTPLNASVRDYAANLKANQAKEYQDAVTEGRPPGQFWLELAAPKVLSDIVESITGVLFVTDQFSSTGVEALFTKLLKPFYDQHITLQTLSHHPTKLLFELFQRQGCKQFKTATETKEKKTDMNVVNILVHNVVLASAEDPDPNIAARLASIFALDALEGDSGFFIRNCDCRLAPSLKKTWEACESQGEQGLDEDVLQESEPEGGKIMKSENEAFGREEGMILD